MTNPTPAETARALTFHEWAIKQGLIISARDTPNSEYLSYSTAMAFAAWTESHAQGRAEGVAEKEAYMVECGTLRSRVTELEIDNELQQKNITFKAKQLVEFRAQLEQKQTATGDASSVEFDRMLEQKRKIQARESRTAQAMVEGTALANALRILLKSRDCLTLDGRAEFPEELSAQFDIGLDDARQVSAALQNKD